VCVYCPPPPQAKRTVQSGGIHEGDGRPPVLRLGGGLPGVRPTNGAIEGKLRVLVHQLPKLLLTEFGALGHEKRRIYVAPSSAGVASIVNTEIGSAMRDCGSIFGRIAVGGGDWQKS
jgi:hypothetical protein